MAREQVMVISAVVGGWATLDLIIGQWLHPQNDMHILDIGLMCAALVVGGVASWMQKEADYRPWIQPHDPMQDHHGRYDF